MKKDKLLFFLFYWSDGCVSTADGLPQVKSEERASYRFSELL